MRIRKPSPTKWNKILGDVIESSRNIWSILKKNISRASSTIKTFLPVQKPVNWHLLHIWPPTHLSLSLSVCTDLIFFKIFYYILWFTKPHIYSRLLDFSNTLESMIVYQIPLVPKFRGCHITFNKVIICTYFMLLKLIIPLNFSFGRRWWFNQTKVHPNFSMCLSWWVKYMSWSHFFHYLPQLTLFETKVFSSSNLFKVMHWIWKS